MEKMALWEIFWKLTVTKFALASECLEILLKANENSKAIRNPNDRIQVPISYFVCGEKLPNHWKRGIFLVIKVER